MLTYLLIKLLCGCTCVSAGFKERDMGHEQSVVIFFFFAFELIILGVQLLKFFLN